MNLHLVLTFHWFGEIQSGRKRIEYRQMTPRWKKLIWDRRDKLGTVAFARGYTKNSETYAIDKIDIGPCPYEGWAGEYYRIHFYEIL